MLSRFSGLYKVLEIALKRLVTLVRAIGTYFPSTLVSSQRRKMFYIASILEAV